MFSETINAVVDQLPHLRGQLAAPWTTLSRWEEVEPVSRSMVMPASVLQAAISLSLLWSWPRMAAALLIGFHGLLRPSEFLPLQRADLILPRDLLSHEKLCYIRILHSKTSRFMLRQHARISDHMTVISWITSSVPCLQQICFLVAVRMFLDIAGTKYLTTLVLARPKSPTASRRRAFVALALVGFSI